MVTRQDIDIQLEIIDSVMNYLDQMALEDVSAELQGAANLLKALLAEDLQRTADRVQSSEMLENIREAGL